MHLNNKFEQWLSLKVWIYDEKLPGNLIRIILMIYYPTICNDCKLCSDIP